MKYAPKRARCAAVPLQKWACVSPSNMSNCRCAQFRSASASARSDSAFRANQYLGTQADLIQRRQTWPRRVLFNDSQHTNRFQESPECCRIESSLPEFAVVFVAMRIWNLYSAEIIAEAKFSQASSHDFTVPAKFEQHRLFLLERRPGEKPQFDAYAPDDRQRF